VKGISGIRKKRKIVDLMLDYNSKNSSQPGWGRTKKSLLVEWNSHNLGYRVASYLGMNPKTIERLKHTDFNNADEGLQYWDFARKFLK